MNNELPFVSIIVPVLNGERTIRECLISLQAWAALTGLAWMAGRTVIRRYQLIDGNRADLYDCYFNFLRKLAVRVGFLWETMTGDQV